MIAPAKAPKEFKQNSHSLFGFAQLLLHSRFRPVLADDLGRAAFKFYEPTSHFSAGYVLAIPLPCYIEIGCTFTKHSLVREP